MKNKPERTTVQVRVVVMERLKEALAKQRLKPNIQDAVEVGIEMMIEDLEQKV